MFAFWWRTRSIRNYKISSRKPFIISSEHNAVHSSHTPLGTGSRSKLARRWPSQSKWNKLHRKSWQYLHRSQWPSLSVCEPRAWWHGRYGGACGDSGKGDSHCRTDVYAVQYQTQWQLWEAVSGGFTCSEPCSTTHINAKQTCKSQKTSTSFSAEIDDEVLKIGAEVSHTEGSSQCTTSQNNYQCSWYVSLHRFLVQMYWYFN